MRRVVLLLTFAVLAGPAMAGPNCTSEPKANWLSEAAMKEKIAALGYKFRVFKVTSGNCYEIYGTDTGGKRIEVYFHPVTGKVVEEHKS
ncbi:MAG TPA: PepSY domain-containing protein [Xanthobacteraceae bacterium]|nr:PepSY domain-containing protein [Xanthobacteraceae bacterium]